MTCRVLADQEAAVPAVSALDHRGAAVGGWHIKAAAQESAVGVADTFGASATERTADVILVTTRRGDLSFLQRQRL